MNGKNRNIVIAIMVVMFLAAFEGTVVTTAMPTIAKNLKGYNLISWVFSAYLLTSAVSTPIYGKLSDLFGRKKMITIGILIFLLGSSLCGFSQNMVQLILFRTIQGIGAGSILTITYTIIGDLFTVSERTKIQGWLSTVWGIASLLGPFLGGFLIDSLSWRWIFFINIPFGLLSIFLLNKNLKETLVKNIAKIDYIGALLLSISIMSVLFGVFVTSPLFKIGCFFILIISLISFYFVENKAEDALVPFSIFTRTTVIANLIGFFISGTLMAVEAYTPLYTQNVLGFGPTMSGLIMAPMSVSWLLSSFVLSRTLPKYGEKKIIQVALLILILSSILLIFIGISTPIIYLIFFVVLMGFGFGCIFTTTTIMVQSAVDYDQRGVSTSTNSLIRTLGQTIGVSIFGGIVNSSISNYFHNLGINGVNSKNIYESMATIDQIKNSFFIGVHNIYLTLIFLTIVCFIISIGLKSMKLDSHT